jgi:hypothetical protein
MRHWQPSASRAIIYIVRGQSGCSLKIIKCGRVAESRASTRGGPGPGIYHCLAAEAIGAGGNPIAGFVFGKERAGGSVSWVVYLLAAWRMRLAIRKKQYRFIKQLQCRCAHDGAACHFDGH